MEKWSLKSGHFIFFLIFIVKYVYMKKILVLFILLLALSCTPKIVINDSNKGDIMIKTMNGNYSNEQFDSMCVADTLPNDFSKWQTFYAADYETGDKIIIYLYLKECGTNESVYKVECISDDSVKIIKRVITD